MPLTLQKEFFKAWYRQGQDMCVIPKESRITFVDLDETPVSIGVSLPFVPVNLGYRHFMCVGKDEDASVGFYAAPHSGWEPRGLLAPLPRAADFFDIGTLSTEQDVHLCDLYSSKEGYQLVFLHHDDAISSDDTFVYYSVMVLHDGELTLKFTVGDLRSPIDVAGPEFVDEWVRGGGK